MTGTYRLSLKAQNDMQELWLYIARNNPAAANRVEAELIDVFEKLAANPYLGHVREDLTDKPVRFWPLYSYHIIYVPENPLTIVRIVSGYREIGDVLEEELL
jgi:plasmid stabilization system protein ParE